MYLIRRWRNGLVAAALVLTVLFTARDAERYGDNLQIALPLAGLGCAIATGGGGEYFARFFGMWLTVHATKRGLPEGGINERPGGGRLGFPSGHTSSAAFGASGLIFNCLSDAPLLKTGVVFAAAFTGASRIEAGAHNIWQVFWGGIWGVLFERALRGRGTLRERAARLGRVIGRALALPRAAVGKLVRR